MESTLVNSTVPANATQIVNYALNGKLLESPESGRSLVVTPASGNSSAALSLPLLLVLIFIVASLVAIIVTAMFVMRRRFSSWKLSGIAGDSDDAKEVDAEAHKKVS